MLPREKDGINGDKKQAATDVAATSVLLTLLGEAASVGLGGRSGQPWRTLKLAAA